MRVYLSVDIEGVTGAQHWDETELGKEGYARLRDRMAQEAVTVARAALAAGAREVFVQDAHDTGRNLRPEEFPRGCRLIRGWSGDPRGMVQELDPSFAALLVVGWHSAAGSGGAPLCHSMSTRFTGLRLNGRPASELTLATLAAAELGVPLALASGDLALCEEARAWLPGLRTVPTQEGRGDSVLCQDAERVLEQLALQTAAALEDLDHARLPELSPSYVLELDYRSISDARRNSYYPGMEQTGPLSLRLACPTLREVGRALGFVG
ncbi:MAG: M55 family metallopeptidase [Candidatus Delongbacteria bacterium]